jgi:small-conductance mechanosensitive channel
VVVDDALRASALDYGIRTFWALVVAAAALLIGRAVRRASMRALTRHRADANAIVLVGNLVQVLALTLGLLVILAIYTQGAFGWILTSFSVIWIVVGLSLQDILKNFFAGIWVLLERPFRIGDAIEVAEHGGEVREISFRTTQLRTADGREIILPNAILMTTAVVNLTRYPFRRGVVWLDVPAGDAGIIDTGQVREAVAAANVAGDPAPTAELRAVSEGKAHYQITFWAKDREQGIVSVVSAVRERFPSAEVRAA